MTPTTVIDKNTGETFEKVFTDSEIAAFRAGIHNLSPIGQCSIITLDDGRKYRIERIWDDLPDDED